MSTQTHIDIHMYITIHLVYYQKITSNSIFLEIVRSHFLSHGIAAQDISDTGRTAKVEGGPRGTRLDPEIRVEQN